MEVRAIAKDIGLSPRKVRLVAGMIQGKKVSDALNMLRFTVTPAARAMAKVVKSAASNAENNNQLTLDELRVKRVLVNQGHVLRRARPQSRGRISPWKRRSSHITVVVEGEA
ncbi:MAG: 50S ribosomal protein L22 [Chloroflexi bacterium]|nr:50S ribosomal protein L22 [Chloroflexota bacterium]